MTRNWLATRHSGGRELAGIAVLYAVYEVVRGAGGSDLQVALGHTHDIVAMERTLHVFGERALQAWVQHVTLLPAVLGLAYMLLHFVGTVGTLVWIYRRHPAAFPLLRTTLIASTALALVGYVVYPAAPPRLAGLGFSDTVSSAAHVNLSSNALGSLYNPLAAVPSLHFGYSLIVAAALVVYGRSRALRVAGAVYPLFMLLVIVGTGNHFFFDAAAGGLTVVLGWIMARSLVAVSARRPARVAGSRTPRSVVSHT